MDNEKWLMLAIQQIDEKVKENVPFEVKQLFKGFDWEQLTKGERILFGKYFANAVREGMVSNVIRVQRANNNHTRYIKFSTNQEGKK